MFTVIKTKLALKVDGAGVYLSEMTYRNNRKQVWLNAIRVSRWIHLTFQWCLMFGFYFTGGAEILFYAGFEEAPCYGAATKFIL